MKYTKLIEKISKYQNEKILPVVTKMEDDPKYAGIMPKLVKEMNDAATWIQLNDHKIGEAEVSSHVTNIDPMLALSDTLSHYQDMFDEKTRSHIVEYLELIDELFQKVKESNVKPME